MNDEIRFNIISFERLLKILRLLEKELRAAGIK